MKTILTVDAQRFSLDGIEFYKNFLSTPVGGTQLTIYNAYDSRNVLMEPTPVDQITLDGVVYPNVAALQSALLPVIYTRDTLGSAGSAISGLQRQLGVFNVAADGQQTFNIGPAVTPPWLVVGAFIDGAFTPFLQAGVVITIANETFAGNTISLSMIKATI